MSYDKNNASIAAPRSRQTGAALVVGLVLLLVLTIVGISGMNTATMQITMASSTQVQQDAFQLAENAIDTALATENYTTAAPRNVNLLGVPNYDRRAVTTYTDINTPIPGEANSAGVPGAMIAWHFEVVATGVGPRNAAAAQRQGFYIRGRSE
jgi:type IV pilus assembly protein PilX